MHALLRHLMAAGLSGVPEPLGIDNDVERLRLVPGAAGSQCWPRQATEHGLRSAARLLRAVHDASQTFVPPDGAVWSVAEVAGSEGSVSKGTICHGDPGPWNMTWHGNTATGLFDWDFAHPAPAIDEVAYALEYFAPFRSDTEAIRWLGFRNPPDRRRRIAAFVEAYGLDCVTGLVDAVIARQLQTIEQTRSLAERGVQPQRDWVASGHLDELRARVRWSEANRALVE
ncbi:aminoglycoside phosphotransferase family protein [Pseudonocardia kunmingensis]|uniref:phosphotransferase n=1 Tax=Pseudonocardia kunmingensis TaxID=630975 RepID=UPI001B8633B6|nr:aminoglycoside phosphotransferase family protein [Pseudonocardia kunmingensis]